MKWRLGLILLLSGSIHASTFFLTGGGKPNAYVTSREFEDHTSRRIRPWIQRNVVVLSPDQTVREAFDAMLLYKIHHLPIVEENRLVGLISEHDVMKAMIPVDDKKVKIPEKKVRDIMSKRILSTSEHSTVSSVVGIMLHFNIHCLPVLSVGRDLVGLITTTDILRLVVNKKESRKHVYFYEQLSRYLNDL